MSEPRVAITLLQSFGRDEALIGDILEEYERRHSRLWLWWQVAVAILLALPYGLAGRSRRHPRMQMPVGILGMLAIFMLITFVAPGAWWLIGMGIAGGAVVAFILVASGFSQRTHKPDGLSLK